MRKTILICVIGAMMLSGCNSSTNKSSNNSIQVTKNIQQSTNNQFIMGGKVVANEQADITTKISGKVSEVAVDIGSKVKQGDVIIKLDAKELQAQVDQAQASVDIAKANLANAVSSARPEQIAIDKASLESATQAYENAKKNYARVEALVNSGAEAKQALDTAKQQLASAEAQYKTTEQQLSMLNNGPTQVSVDVYRAQVGQAEAGLKVAQTALNNAVITAPIDGVVNAKKINVGELASPGTTLISLVNSSQLYVNAYAPLEIISDLKEGQEVAIKVSELPDKSFKGKVVTINSKLNDQSRNILVKVSIEEANTLVKPGMFAQIGLIGLLK